MLLELGWLGLIGLILLVIVIYTFVLLYTFKKVMDTQKGRYLFSVPITTFSIKSRIHTIMVQLGVGEDDIDYLGKGMFEVRGDKVEVDSFFGVVAKKIGEEGKEEAIYDEDVMKFNLPNLKVENIQKESEGE